MKQEKQAFHERDAEGNEHACGERNGSYLCTRPLNHDLDHVASNGKGTVLQRWVNVEKPDRVQLALKDLQVRVFMDLPVGGLMEQQRLVNEAQKAFYNAIRFSGPEIKFETRLDAAIKEEKRVMVYTVTITYPAFKRLPDDTQVKVERIAVHQTGIIATTEAAAIAIAARAIDDTVDDEILSAATVTVNRG